MSHGATIRIFLTSLFLVLAGLQPLPASATAENDEAVNYIVKKNDTLLGLARQYFNRTDDYLIVQQRNAIANPYKIPIGTQITIPIRILKVRPAKARLSAYRGQIMLVDRAGQSLAPRTGAQIAEFARLSTGPSSSLSLTLDDGSIITMPSNSAMRIMRLRTLLLTGSVDYEFALEKGGVRSKVTPFKNAQDRYRIRTPVAVSAVRGTDFRNRFEPDSGEAMAELIEGGLDLDTATSAEAMAAPMRLQSEFGAIIGQAGIRTEKLLPAPSLEGRFSTQSQGRAAFTIIPPANATGYRLQIARDSNFIEIVDDHFSSTPKLSAEGLAAGHYFAKITSFAPSGLEGMPRNFAFRQNANRRAEQTGDGFVFRWTASEPDNPANSKTRYRFQLYHASYSEQDADRPPYSAMPIVDEAALRETSILLSEMETGTYFWRVGISVFHDGQVSENWSGFNRFQFMN